VQNFRRNPAQRRDHHQELTDKIIVALEAGTAPWRRPWDKTACDAATAPVNAATGHRYRGINLFVLGMSPLAFASNDPRWCTYRQAAARGWQVRKGEKATPVYLYKPIEIEDQTSDGGRETRRIPMLRTGSVTATVASRGLPGMMADDDLVCPPPVSARDHPARRLALCAFHAQLSRRRRSAR
jgi:antirestriction protein ArdC